MPTLPLLLLKKLLANGRWKIGALLLLAVALLGIGYYRGYQHEKLELTGKLNNALQEKKSVTDAYSKFVADTNAARAQQAREQAALVSSLQHQLEVANANQKVVVRTIRKEVIRYVSPKADAACTVNRGFVQLYNDSIHPDAEAGAELSSGPTGDAAADSGVALHTVAEIAAENNRECVARGELIRRWQQWYMSSKQVFDRAKEVGYESVGVVADTGALGADVGTVGEAQSTKARDSPEGHDAGSGK